MFEKLISVISWISNLRLQNTYDPILNEYRGYQWRMVVCAGCLPFLLIGWLIFEFLSQSMLNNYFSAMLSELLVIGNYVIAFLMVVCCSIFLVNAIQFMMFCKEYGISS